MSIHLAFKKTANSNSNSAAGIGLRLFFVIALISLFWAGNSNKSAAGHWYAPPCGGQSNDLDGDDPGLGCQAAYSWKNCAVPWMTVERDCHLVNPTHLELTLHNGNTGAFHDCYGGIEVETSPGHCITLDEMANNNGCKGGGTAANPVEIGTGRKIETTVDWTSGGVNPLIFERKYSSRFEVVSAPFHSRLGFAWRSNFDARAKYQFSTGNTNPTLAVSGNLIHIALPDSIEYSFKLNGGIWKPVLPRQNPLTGVYWDQYRTDLDVALILTSSSVTLRTEAGIKYTFDLEGKLAKIVDNAGYAQYLSYSGNLNAAVVDSFGRKIIFEYWEDAIKIGLLKSATFDDGKKILFDYASPYTASPVTLIPYDTSMYALSTVVLPDATPATDADNPKLVYEYLQNAEYPYALTGIFDERGIKFASWTYDAKGRALTSQHSGGDGLTTFSYDDVNNKVTVTNALGRSTVYSFQKVLGLIQRLTAVDGVATTNCAASNTVYAYDANSFRTQATDAEGRISKWVRNSRGLATSNTEGFGTAVARTTTTTWDATRPLPTQIVAPGLTTNITYNAASQVTSLSQVDTTTTTVPYSTNGQTRTTAFNYTSFTAPSPPVIGPSGTPLSDVALTLTNPDAEAGTTTGWTNTTGAIGVRTSAPCDVSKCFFGGTVASSVAHQDVAIPGANTAEVDASQRAAKIAWKQNSYEFSDRASVRLIFLNGAGTVIGSAVNEIKAEYYAWVPHERIVPLPALTRTIRVQMMMERTNGTNNDGYIDDITLTLVADGTAAAKPYLRPVNPDALSGGTTGWTVSTGTIAPQTTSPCNYFACFKETGSGIDSFYQTLTLPTDRITEIDGLARGLELQWIDRATEIQYKVSAKIEFLDNADQVMADSTSASPLLSSVDLWKPRLHYADIPAGARKVKIALNFNQPNTFGGSGTYFTGLTARLVGRSVAPDPLDILTSVDGPLAGTGDTVSYQYDTKGNITQVTDELGHTDTDHLAQRHGPAPDHS